MPGTMVAPGSRRDSLAVPLDSSDVRDPKLFLDKKPGVRAALPPRLRLHFAPADIHGEPQDFEFHSMRKPFARRKRQEPVWTDEKVPTGSSVMWSAVPSLTIRGSSLDMNSHGHYGHRRIRGDSVKSASSHDQRRVCPVLYRALQPVWNPAGY